VNQKVPSIKKPLPPKNYGLSEAVTSDGENVIIINEDGIQYIVDLEMYAKKLSSAPCWEK
jgi:hypothetical protein